MYKHILIATDGSDLASKGLDHGLALAKAVGARATIVTVTDAISAGIISSAGMVDVAGYQDSLASAASDILGTSRKRADQLGVQADARHIPNRYPADAIVETVNELGCDLVVMASHGRRGFRRVLLGSQTTEVLTNSPVPVLVVR